MKKVGILMESDYYEPEIAYYQHRFQEENITVDFLTRLWGQSQLTFTGHENKLNTITVNQSFEHISDQELQNYAAIIIPSGMVADRLRYTEDVYQIPPATAFLKRVFANKNIIKGIICHGLWLTAPATEIIKDRKLTCHNNLIGDARAYGAEYINADVVIDEDLVTARSGDHCHLLAKKIIELIFTPVLHHVALNCKDIYQTEAFYENLFGFQRARVIPIDNGGEIIFLKLYHTYLELFQSNEDNPQHPLERDGYSYQGIRHFAFKVKNLDQFLQDIQPDITLGPANFDDITPGWKTVWIRDPDGRIIEVSQGYQDQVDLIKK